MALAAAYARLRDALLAARGPRDVLYRTMASLCGDRSVTWEDRTVPTPAALFEMQPPPAGAVRAARAVLWAEYKARMPPGARGGDTPATWLMPGFARSPIAPTVERLLARDGVDVLRAPTGSGKSQAYLEYAARAVREEPERLFVVVAANVAAVHQLYTRAVAALGGAAGAESYKTMQQLRADKEAAEEYTYRVLQCSVFVTTYHTFLRDLPDTGRPTTVILDECVTGMEYILPLAVEHGRFVRDLGLRASSVLVLDAAAAPHTAEALGAAAAGARYHELPFSPMLRTCHFAVAHGTAEVLAERLRRRALLSYADRRPVVLCCEQITPAVDAAAACWPALREAYPSLRVGLLRAAPPNGGAHETTVEQITARLRAGGAPACWAVWELRAHGLHQRNVLYQATAPKFDVLVVTEAFRAGVSFPWEADSTVVMASSRRTACGIVQTAHRVRLVRLGVWVVRKRLLAPPCPWLPPTRASGDGDEHALLRARQSVHAARARAYAAVCDLMRANGYLVTCDAPAAEMAAADHCYLTELRARARARAGGEVGDRACGAAGGYALGAGEPEGPRVKRARAGGAEVLFQVHPGVPGLSGPGVHTVAPGDAVHLREVLWDAAAGPRTVVLRDAAATLPRVPRDELRAHGVRFVLDVPCATDAELEALFRRVVQCPSSWPVEVSAAELPPPQAPVRRHVDVAEPAAPVTGADPGRVFMASGVGQALQCVFLGGEAAVPRARLGALAAAALRESYQDDDSAVGAMAPRLRLLLRLCGARAPEGGVQRATAVCSVIRQLEGVAEK